MGHESYNLGIQGEEIACNYLKENEFEIIDRNFRSHQGEIDIICRDKGTLVFVEVKFYSYRSYFTPAYAVNKNKKGSIAHAARYYLHKHKLYNSACRFDVIAIYRKQNEEQTIDHIKNAFGVK